MKTSRREFLTTAAATSAVLAVGARPPRFLLDAAAAEPDAGSENVLVVIQLTGGNDGLNTVVPYADDQYHKNRPTLAISESNVLQIDDHCGFHPSLRGFADLLEAGRLAVVQGVGYPDPNRSHFESMDIWHSCHRNKRRREYGWLGRFLDETDRPDGQDVPALHFGGEKQPLALASQDVRVPSVRSLEQFRLQLEDDKLKTVVDHLVSARREQSDSLLGFVQTSAESALAASRRVGTNLQDYEAKEAYPESELAQKLRIVAQLIDSGLGTRIYYTELDGFDTHSQQADAHAGLLRQLGDAVAAFINDVAAHGHANRILLMTFSEFGRRVQENASAGTDHGAAAPMFLAGGSVQSGLVGAHPRLDDLQDGDLKHHTDFRQVYATVLEQWLQCRSEPVLGNRYETLPVLSTAIA